MGDYLRMQGVKERKVKAVEKLIEDFNNPKNKKGLDGKYRATRTFKPRKRG